MSYNIDTWKTKRLENFCLPVASLYKHERTDWHPEREDYEDGTIFTTFEGVKLSGTIKNDTFYCTDITCSGEGSGTSMWWILQPAFQDSQGILIASCVWEGGDTINQLRITNGEIEWIDIDI